MSDEQKQVDDGGPAYAHSGFYLEKAGLHSEPQSGMTLRDYFAANAMQSILNVVFARVDRHEREDGSDDDLILGFENDDALGWAESAYSLADAMLAERTRSK